MDLRLFHPDDDKTRDYKVLDWAVSRSGFFACHFHESIGWYNLSLALRLLGHYRLFQLFKTKYSKNRTELSPVHAYILQYRETGKLKIFFARFVAILHPFVQFGETDRFIEIHSINRMLLHERADILQNFLAAAEEDFDRAFSTARDQILNPTFLYDSPATITAAVHIHPIIKEVTPPPPDPPLQPKGKEKDVFSKKQLLLLFDLLACAGMIEPIDFRKPNKFENIAHLLRAITGRTEDTWVGELKNHVTKDPKRKNLYHYESDGGRQQLIRDLTNLSEKFRNAGFESIAKLADQKIIELEHAAP